MTDRRTRILEVEREMASLGRFIVFSVDVDDVRELYPDCSLEVATDVAANTAWDLSENDVGSIPLDAAIENAMGNVND